MTVRRGFALPLVLMFGLVAGVTIAYMLERGAAQRQTLLRQIDGYRAHHAGRGMSEIMEAWIRQAGNARSTSGESVPSGKVLELELPDGSRCEISISDGQDKVLPPPEGELITELHLLHQRLAELVGAGNTGAHTRYFGPPSMSANTAPAVLLTAAALASTEGQVGEAFSNAVLQARARGPIREEELDTIAQGAGITGPAFAKLSTLVAAEPRLFRVRARWTFPGTRPPEVFEGIADLSPRAGAAGGVSSIWDRRSPLHDWKRVADDGPPGAARDEPAPAR